MKDKLIRAAINYIYQLDDFPVAAVESQIRKELNEILELNAEDILCKRRAHIGVGAKEDYLNQWIETSEGYVLAGIRHMNGNPEEPFVYMWPSFRIEHMKNVITQLMPYFEKFSPKTFNFWIRPDCNNHNIDIIQQRFIGRIDEMVKCDMALKVPSDYYDWYVDQYKLFHDEKPEYADRIPVNDKDMMDSCLEEGLLFFMEEDDKKIGLIAGENEIFMNKSSTYLDEILVASEFRGKGYANKLLGSFVGKLNSEYLTCYIDSDNIPSTRTALSAGEKVFSQECSVKVI